MIEGIEESISSPPDPSRLIQDTRRVHATDFQESDITPLGLGLEHFLEKASSKSFALLHPLQPLGIIRIFPRVPSESCSALLLFSS
ncbi:hypothetical protein CEXT_596881 [Caerostris extrusa]|uniref:Uncharacterized protein n=1 Tax=Caerostris extrusa TaxID=172846 RepID=A0AAV4TA23_CAEEX|nr:hypothetical protein CEXT_596881 [Caerostris extrusa]